MRSRKNIIRNPKKIIENLRGGKKDEKKNICKI